MPWTDVDDLEVVVAKVVVNTVELDVAGLSTAKLELGATPALIEVDMLLSVRLK